MPKTASNLLCGCGLGAGICCTREQGSPIVLFNLEAGLVRGLEHSEKWPLALAGRSVAPPDGQFHGVVACRGDESFARPGFAAQ